MLVLSQEITLMEMDNDTIQELIAGYAIGALDEAELVQVENLLQTNEQARDLLAEFEAVTAGLALSVEPVEMPAGSLERLRQKAGVDLSSKPAPQHTEARTSLISMEGGQSAPDHKNNYSTLPRKSYWQTKPLLAYAAALVLFVTTAVFGLLWLNTNNKLEATEQNRVALADMVNKAEQNRVAFASVLAAPGLKVADLKATGSSADGSVRLYADPSTNKVFMVAQNLTTLPSDKEYEAWLITADSQSHQAGLLGTGANKGAGVIELTTTGPISQYKQVALTIEKKGGAYTPTLPPVLAGTIPI